MKPSNQHTDEERDVLNMLWRMGVPLQARPLDSAVWRPVQPWSPEPDRWLRFSTHQFRRAPTDEVV